MELDGVTLPAACREIGKPRTWGERVVWEYRETLPEPQRLGIVRVWPRLLIDRLRDIAKRESFARHGSGPWA